LPRQGRRRPLRLDARSRPGPRDRPRSFLGDFLRRADALASAKDVAARRGLDRPRGSGRRCALRRPSPSRTGTADVSPAHVPSGHARAGALCAGRSLDSLQRLVGRRTLANLFRSPGESRVEPARASDCSDRLRVTERRARDSSRAPHSDVHARARAIGGRRAPRRPGRRHTCGLEPGRNAACRGPRGGWADPSRVSDRQGPLRVDRLSPRIALLSVGRVRGGERSSGGGRHRRVGPSSGPGGACAHAVDRMVRPREHRVAPGRSRDLVHRVAHRIASQPVGRDARSPGASGRATPGSLQLEDISSRDLPFSPIPSTVASRSASPRAKRPSGTSRGSTTRSPSSFPPTAAPSSSKSGEKEGGPPAASTCDDSTVRLPSVWATGWDCRYLQTAAPFSHGSIRARRSSR
jgi:hypothetical protein